jgi:hypothetical protein
MVSEDVYVERLVKSSNFKTSKQSKKSKLGVKLFQSTHDKSDQEVVILEKEENCFLNDVIE